ncbi:DUF1566 domain-containing protein [Lysobacter sp. 5GHs7-4]|uniref:Lcl C-terminal domain-containing protein n=1 Tax=Lysobacter sp. 5GHs7-4 TaxID=2904253 RepID=UPI001E3BC301|nr:DUF1566 domain-containing protein [Lysobacter sp. 5GHs7-4]UHQ21935.1 DUF1566 domain-containing protein [Lysobacter sp. 5GHs7-4]
MPNSSVATVAGANVQLPALEWSALTLLDGAPVDHATAVQACADLGPGWRVPTLTELLSLVRYDRSGPAIDTDLFPETQSGAYWTSQPLAAMSDRDVWIVDFFSGSTGNYRKEGNFAFVRAVRTVSPAEGESQ